MSDLAARLRAALVGDYTGDVMPFDELKPEIQARWQRVADAARLRVPFSDAQIERMARAAREAWAGVDCWENMSDVVHQQWRKTIRAALAAGGLEPCAVPEYKPEDVALAPNDDELWRTPLEMKDCDGDTLVIDSQDKNSAILRVKHFFGLTPSAAARMAAWLSSYAAAHGACAPTGHVLRDRLVKAEAKIERQRAELERLNAHNRTITEGYKAEIAALRERARVPVKVRFEVTEQDMRAVWHESGGIDDLMRKIKDYLAAHAVIDAPAGVPSLDPPEDRVEALARVLCDAYCASNKNYGQEWEGLRALGRSHYMAEARAAIAHMRQRPEGLPTREQMAQIIYKAGWCKSYVWDDNDSGSERNQIYAEADAILAALTPFLRDPVGKPELDVTINELVEVYCNTYSGKHRDDWQAVLDLCRSRIRPVFECKECAKKEAELRRHNDKWAGFIQRCQADAQNARAALEGE